MSGDMPCNAPCRNATCHWCVCGECFDNAPCDEQTKEGGES